jgi:hypothetical protein
MTLVEAAEVVLQAAGGVSLTAREIAEKAVAAKLITPKSLRPWVQLQAAIRESNSRLEKQGKPAQFTAKDGKWGLAKK